MHVVENGYISHVMSRPEEQRFATFTGLCPLESGALISVFQVGREKQDPFSTIGMCRSDDGGATWQPIPAQFISEFRGVPGSFAGTEIVEVRAGVLMLCTTWFDRSDPSRPLLDPGTLGILPTKQLRAFSTDDGSSWSAWEEIPVGDLKACALTGPPIRWSDGTFALPFESYKEYNDTRPPQHGAWLLLSQDGGISFTTIQCVAQHHAAQIFYWDQRLCALTPTGDYVAMFWTHDMKSQQDLNVHLRRGSVFSSHPDDLPMATNIPGQIAAPAVLPDGRWLAFVVDRKHPCTLKLWVSHDEGRTWPEEEALRVYKHDEQGAISQNHRNVDYSRYWEDMLKWTFGHPAIRILANGQLLLSYYAGSPSGTSIHWAKVNVGSAAPAERSDAWRIDQSVSSGSRTLSPPHPHLLKAKSNRKADSVDGFNPENK